MNQFFENPVQNPSLKEKFPEDRSPASIYNMASSAGHLVSLVPFITGIYYLLTNEVLSRDLHKQFAEPDLSQQMSTNLMSELLMPPHVKLRLMVLS